MSSPSPTPAEQLTACREAIDIIDRQLLDLLNERTKVVEVIGRIKRENAIPVYEPKREGQVLRNVLDHNTGPMPPDAIQRIFERIMDEMRTLQKMRSQAQC